MHEYPNEFDAIVIGAGHAGCEAALACARMRLKTLLITQELDTAAQMSCNPAIGGIAKGQIVREIDALGGEMAKNTDASALHYHMLNTGKGAAVHSPRAQCDKKLYHLSMKHTLEKQPMLQIAQDEAVRVIDNGKSVSGVETLRQTRYKSKTVILSAGTFLNGIIHIGLKTFKGGRYNHPASDLLPESLRELGFAMSRLKTGTPMRLNARTIDFSKCKEQPSDNPFLPFSHFTKPFCREFLSCWITRTTETTHEIIKQNLDQSPLYSGVIKSTGPRYCPSIEDKIVKFAQKTWHPVFLEPEGFSTLEYYANGLSTSLPEHVQMEIIHSVAGLEKAEILRPGYAIEYDYFDPTQLYPWLEAKPLPGLFMAGQINGTTGYEEAAAQGLMAGINAALKIKALEPFVLNRNQAYIGVLIDDLVTKGVNEPYRMFTSRAEYRLLLRADNADIRLMDYGFNFGLIDNGHKPAFEKYKAAVSRLASSKSAPGDETSDIQPWSHEKAAAHTAIEKKYSGYIERHLKEALKLKKADHITIPPDFDPSLVSGLLTESRQKLGKIRPRTLGQAARIPGVTPADVQLLMVHIERHRLAKSKGAAHE